MSTVKQFKAAMRRVAAFVHGKRTAIIVLLINAAILTLGTYFMNNMPLFTGENLDLYSVLEYGKRQVCKPHYVNDSVLLINVAYDRQSATRMNDNIVLGNTDVTDRKALYQLLLNLDSMATDSTYRYIFMDVRFERGVVTEWDSVLYAKLGETPRLVIADHGDTELASDVLKPVAAYSDYPVTLTATNFLRCQFLHDGRESMPLKAYHELCNDSVTRHGWFYTSSHGLCQNTHVVRCVLDMDTVVKEIGNTAKLVPAYHNLNRINKASDLKTLARDKYIVIGDMVDDRHDTFYGNVPGSVLVFSAYWALKNGEHLVKPWVELLFFTIFFATSLSLFSRIPIINRVAWIRNIKSRLVRFLLTLLGYSTVLTIITVVLFLCFGIVSSIWIPAVYFSLQRAYFTYKRMSV